jgi:hypothetical protein
MFTYRSFTSTQKEIGGAQVFTKDKTDLTVLAVGDKFSYFLVDRYVIGKILSLPIDFTTDLDDETKISLILDY